MSQPFSDGLNRRALLINGFSPDHDRVVPTPLGDLAVALRVQGFDVTFIDVERSGELPEQIARAVRSGRPEDPLLIHYLGHIALPNAGEDIFLAFGQGRDGLRYNLQSVLLRPAAWSQSTLITLDIDLDRKGTRPLARLLEGPVDHPGTMWTMATVRTEDLPGPETTLTQALASAISRIGAGGAGVSAETGYVPFPRLAQLVSDEVRSISRGGLGLSTTRSEATGASFRHFPNPGFVHTPEALPGVFGRELRRRRTDAGLSLADLARQVHYSAGHLSKVENGAKPPSPDLARRSDYVLGASGALMALVPSAAVFVGAHTDDDGPEIPAPQVLAGGISADRVDPGVGIPLSDDQLSLSAYVRMLSTTIAHRDTPMPLSLGLFGKWGSGKSYLMGLMRAEIKRLSESGNEAYLPDIVQIGFNAWHYSDTNLWASLGDEIFRQLAGPEEDVEAKRTRMNAELLETRQYHILLEAQADRAREETQELKGRLDEVSSQQDVTARELLKQLSTSESMKKKLAQLWSRLGVTDEVEQAKALSEEIRGTAAEVSALSQLLRSRVGRVATGVAIAALGLFAVAALVPADWGTWLSRLGVATLASSAGTGIAALARFRKGLVQLQQVATEIRDGALAESKQRNEPKVNELLAVLRAKEAEHDLVQAQLEQLVIRAGELGRQLGALAPGQRLYSFVTERAAGDSYTKHLGLVSTIRKDFQNLAELMAAWRKRTKEDQGHRPIDRVVLYIDDLDRCHPKQVVQVLQAVHLLLALDPFVVVVGVDPRWLIQSLRQHYDGVLSPEDQGDWSIASPGYLEKIFNIPFIVPDMPIGGLGQLIRGLAGPLDQPDAPDVPDVFISYAASDAEAAGKDETAGNEEVPDDLLEVPVAAPTLLTEEEVEFMAALEPFVETPRDAKRLFNLYRMLRSTPDLVDAGSFLGEDEYQAVAILLGLLTYDANLLSQIMNELLAAPAKVAWGDFVARMEPLGDNGLYTNGIVGVIASDAVGSWTKLHSGAVQTVPKVTLADLSAFQKWAPRIRRFSFVLSADTES